MKQKILDFLKDKKDFVRINDFIKSTYPLHKGNERPIWDNPRESKFIKSILEQLRKERAIEIKNNLHNELGSFYYWKDDPKTRYHSLSSLNIEVRAM